MCTRWSNLVGRYSFLTLGILGIVVKSPIVDDGVTAMISLPLFTATVPSN